MADFRNQSECIIQDLHSELKDMQEKESIMGVRRRQNKSCQKTVQLARKG